MSNYIPLNQVIALFIKKNVDGNSQSISYNQINLKNLALYPMFLNRELRNLKENDFTGERKKRIQLVMLIPKDDLAIDVCIDELVLGSDNSESFDSEKLMKK